MKDIQPETPPIDVVLKSLLLDKSNSTGDLLNDVSFITTGKEITQPLPKKHFVYQNFSRLMNLTPKQINDLSSKELAEKLYLLEQEELDFLASKLPENSLEDFCNFVDNILIF